MNRSGDKSTRIIDQNIHPIPFIFDELGKIQHFGFDAHVGNFCNNFHVRKTVVEVHFHSFQVRFVATAHRKVVAFGGENFGNGTPDSFRRTRNNGFSFHDFVSLKQVF